MKLTLPEYRRTMFILAAVVFAVAVVLALGVTGPVKAEVTRGGTPERALQAFWFNIGLNLLSAVALALVAARSKGRNRISTTLHIVVGLTVMFLGFALVDAASAYHSHGPEMQTASMLLYVCGGADLLAGVSAIVTAFLQPKDRRQPEGT